MLDIVDTSFSAYAPAARWRMSDQAMPFITDVPSRTYCCQYRETDLAFSKRLLAEEGWRGVNRIF